MGAMTWSVIEGDCVEVMRGMEECSIDAIVTDPPYSLGFMGKSWDRNLNHGPWATEALRVLKPGGHLLSFGGTRTYHRLTCALEDAGFEIRDCLAWLYGSGFPKSLDVSKAIDKAAGAEREVVGSKLGRPGMANDGSNQRAGFDAAFGGEATGPMTSDITAPATPDAERWQGWGTALKPAFEPIVLARKPLSERTVAANVQRWGTGALNIDGCRIEFEDEDDEQESKDKNRHADFGSGARENEVYGEDKRTRAEQGNYDAPGRWPANVVLDEEAAALLDEQTGASTSSDRPRLRREMTSKGRPGGGYGQGGADATHAESGVTLGYADAGGASRFFYVPKTDRAEREKGLEHRAASFGPWLQDDGRPDPRPLSDPRMDRQQIRNPSTNSHPTVKPVELMAWLCRMVTPPGGTVLDPFTGSGSTGIAALREGFGFTGIEREHEYVQIARLRIEGDAPLFNTPDDNAATEGECIG